MQPPAPIEVNKMGPTIQQGVIQCLVQQRTQLTAAGARRRNTVNAAHLTSLQQRRTAPQN